MSGADQRLPEVASVTAEECRDMGDVRAEIDRLDRQLVALIAERTRYIEAAARIKPSADDVRVEWRIQDVLDKVAVSAGQSDLPIEIALPVWKELVERSIAHEAVVWRSIRAGSDGESGDQSTGAG